MTSITSTPHTVLSGEIDLSALVRFIWRQKLLIATFTACCAAIATAYSFSVTPEYVVSAVLRPAELKDLDGLNRTKVYSLPPDEALKRVGSTLDSYDARLGYFRSNPKLQNAFMKEGRSVEQAFEDFNSAALKLVTPDTKKSGSLSSFIGLDMRYAKGVDGKAVLNEFVRFAIEKERSQISKDLEVMVRNRINEIDAKLDIARIDYSSNKEGRIAELLEADKLQRAKLNDELRAVRAQLKMRREDRIAQLNEAISIARTLGLKRPSTPSSMGQVGVEASGNIIRTEVTNQQIPLYFMGTDALEAERHALQNRKSDDFADSRIAEIRKELLLLESNRKVQVLQARQNEELFLKGIESLRAERARLAAINTDMSTLQLVKIDRPAVDPLKPVSPNKTLIVAVGALLGCALGVALALMRYMMLRQPHELNKVELASVAHMKNTPIALG